MRVLITGGAGYVGSACLRHLVVSGHEALAYDDLSQGHRAAIEDIAPLVEGDVLDSELLARTLSDFRADAVMHFAAAASVGESVIRPDFYYRNNVAGTASVLEAMREAGVGRMLFSSSCSVYGSAVGETISEATLQLPLSPYARTKAAVEWMIEDYARAYGLAFTLLRYFNAAGAAPGSKHGEDHRPETHLIPIVLQAAAGVRDGFQVYGDDFSTRDGTCIRDYVHVDDLAQAHRLAIEATSEDTGEVYNVGTGRGQSVLEVIAACEKVSGRSVPYEIVGRRAGDAPILVADPSKLTKGLGWKPAYLEIESTIETAWAWHSRNPNGYPD
jgi:UDP-glucose 4-epimerase